MFEIGDYVRVIPPTYVELAKGFFLYTEYWCESNPTKNKHAMLGGKYKILAVEKEENGNIFYLLLPNAINYAGHMLSNFLLLDKDVKNCPFNVGDSVKLALTDEEAKQQYFPLHDKDYRFDDRNNIFIITAVLNDFYIFLNYEKDATNSAPFRWDNFKLVR